MNKIRNTVFLLLFFALVSYGAISQQTADGYYDSIEGKKGKELKTALHRLIKEHTVLEYGKLWEAFSETDNKGNDQVWDMYSNEERYFTGLDRSVVQREHALPKSWWSISKQADTFDAYTDLHHLMPADGEANKAKNNYVLGTVTSPSFDNRSAKVGPNTYPGAPKCNAFEPCDEYKGDFARIYLYMITCYENYYKQWRAEALKMLRKETYPMLQPWASEMLLEWHRMDPVSAKEINRNEMVYRLQGNRNPYIDYPELVEHLWGNRKEESFFLPAEEKKPSVIQELLRWLERVAKTELEVH